MRSRACDAHRVHGLVVVDRLAVPGTEVDVRIDDRRWWRSRHRWYAGHERDLAAARCEEARNAVGGERHLEAALVEQAMVEAAEKDQVVEVGLAAAGPVLDVVGLNEPPVRAHREAAAAIARPQRAANRDGNGARLAADVEDTSVSAGRDGDERAVAADAPKGLRGDARSVVQVCVARAVRTEHRLIEMNHDLRNEAVAGLGRLRLRP